jgi:hypothetical protein
VVPPSGVVSLQAANASARTGRKITLMEPRMLTSGYSGTFPDNPMRIPQFFRRDKSQAGRFAKDVKPGVEVPKNGR